MIRYVRTIGFCAQATACRRAHPFAGRNTNMKTVIARVSVVTMLVLGGAASGDLMKNLDFESYSGSGADLLPDWTRNDGNYMWPLLDALPISTAGLGLVSTNGTYLFPLSGNYSLFFSSGVDNVGGSTYPEVAISQTGLVPVGATHIRITTTFLNTSNVRFSYTLGNISLIDTTPEAIGSGFRYTTGIGSLAGQTSTLRFAVQYIGDPGTPGGWHLVDDIEFVAIPEPATSLLGLVGTAMLIGARRCAANRRLERTGVSSAV